MTEAKELETIYVYAEASYKLMQYLHVRDDDKKSIYIHVKLDKRCL